MPKPSIGTQGVYLSGGENQQMRNGVGGGGQPWPVIWMEDKIQERRKQIRTEENKIRQTAEQRDCERVWGYPRFESLVHLRVRGLI